AGRSRDARSCRISDRTSEQTQYICCERLMGSFSPSSSAGNLRLAYRGACPRRPQQPKTPENTGTSSLPGLDRGPPEVDLLRVDRLIDRNGARAEDIVPVIAGLIDAQVDEARLHRDRTGRAVLHAHAHAGHGGVQDVADLRPRPDLEEAREALAEQALV